MHVGELQCLMSLMNVSTRRDTNLRLNVVYRRDDFPSLALKLLDSPASGLRLSFECTWRIHRTHERAVPGALWPDDRFRNQLERCEKRSCRYLSQPQWAFTISMRTSKADDKYDQFYYCLIQSTFTFSTFIGRASGHERR